MSIFYQRLNVTGKCSAANHCGWVDIETISTGMARLITSHSSTNGDHESSNAFTEHITLTKRIDKTSPYLLTHACDMRGKKMGIHLTKTDQDGAAEVYYEQ